MYSILKAIAQILSFYTCRPTQQPDGTLSPISIPAPQIIRELQPNAKFIITLSDPVQRLYSDYYFLEDDRTVVKQNRINSNVKSSTKSAKAFHGRVVEQIDQMQSCIQDEMLQFSSDSGAKNEENEENDKETEEVKGTGTEVGSPNWFRASQM